MTAPPEETVTAETTPAALSTQPAPAPPGPAGRSLWGRARQLWRRLTSMRTALVLLFLLALAAVPGSLLPQRPLNPTKVDQYLAQHRTIGPWLDRARAFDVFASPWFAAIYLLLFISLVGCLGPRIRIHVRALRQPPPRAPRHLSRLPESTSYAGPDDPTVAAARAAAGLRKGRWRVRVRVGDEAGGVVTVSAEKGYLRETGNLIFHIAVTLLLVVVAIGKLWSYSGTILVQAGGGQSSSFCNVVQQYDSFRPGPMVNGSDLAPFCTTLESFTATYDSDGTARQFTGQITYTDGISGPTHSDALRVNHPLRLEGLRLYLLGHGYSPIFTVRDPSGRTFTQAVPFLPQDGNFTSQGAAKFADARPREVGIDGVFAPTATFPNGILTSTWPAADSPAVAIFVYEGSLGLDSGAPQSVYSLDQQQIASGALKKVASVNLQPGGSVRLKDGTTVRFDGVKQWANLQIAHDPTQGYLLPVAGLLVLGLLLSIRIRRRRIWLRCTPMAGLTSPAETPGTPGARTGGERRTVSEDHPREEGPGPARRTTAVEAGGLARTDAGVFGEEFERVVAGLRGTPATAAEREAE
ncbi:MAG: cytochrome c biogenesis protein ResB [Mycobacteriales bacterium]